MSQAPTTIFIIDDDEIYQFTAKKTIELLKFEGNVVCFRNGQLGLNYLLEHSADALLLPDIILLDINMPVMNGWQFLELFGPVRETLCKQASIYMVSSSLDRNEAIRSRQYPAVVDFVVKPLQVDQITKILNPITPADLI